ncbi:MAG: hypothetical protein ACI9LZ_004234, partial [Glaciecola sp.]
AILRFQTWATHVVYPSGRHVFFAATVSPRTTPALTVSWSTPSHA